MSEKNETEVQVIENASPKDVRPGDYTTWECVDEFGGATIYERREGIACSSTPSGKWFTEAGVCLTGGVPRDDFTLTIRRPVQPLPTEKGAVIAPADGRKRVEAEESGKTWSAREAVLSWDGQWHGIWRSGDDVHIFVSPKSITPGTWKVEEN